jgi:hypothetical protein
MAAVWRARKLQNIHSMRRHDDIPFDRAYALDVLETSLRKRSRPLPPALRARRTFVILWRRLRTVGNLVHIA